MHNNINVSHPLIPREQNYLLSYKYVTIHSEDRDVTKYPNSNQFDIKLPQIMENVKSIRLIYTSFPRRYYTFSNEYQNTKLSFVVFFDTVIQEPIDCADIITIEIQPGFYSISQFTTEVQTKMNKCISNRLDKPYTNMRVRYDVVGKRILIGNNKHPFLLLLDRKECYKDVCKQPTMWDFPVKWGLGYYLGFERRTYISTCVENGVSLDYETSISNRDWLVNTNGNVFLSVSPFAPDIEGEDVMYIEIEKYNAMDELKLCPLNTNGVVNNTYGGFVNSAFAKVFVGVSNLDNTLDLNKQSVVFFDIPEEKISKLHFKFRYHDGRLVDFAGQPFNITLEFAYLKNEIEKSYKVRLN